MRYLTLLLLVLSGCMRYAPTPLGSPPAALTPISSPNGELTLTPSINRSKQDATKYLCVAFDITDSSGTSLHHVQSSASDGMKWAIGWFDDFTIVLQSRDIGPRAWKLHGDQTITEIPSPWSAELTEFADRLLAEKYPD